MIKSYEVSEHNVILDEVGQPCSSSPNGQSFSPSHCQSASMHECPQLNFPMVQFTGAEYGLIENKTITDGRAVQSRRITNNWRARGSK